MANTPLTDAAEFPEDGCWTSMVVPADLARTLETDRSELIEAVMRWAELGSIEQQGEFRALLARFSHRGG